MTMQLSIAMWWRIPRIVLRSTGFGVKPNGDDYLNLSCNSDVTWYFRHDLHPLLLTFQQNNVFEEHACLS